MLKNVKKRNCTTNLQLAYVAPRIALLIARNDTYVHNHDPWTKDSKLENITSGEFCTNEIKSKVVNYKVNLKGL